MGSIYACKCDNCGFRFSAHLGTGFMYPEEYCETVQNMKAGLYGKQGKQFFEEHPDGAITCNNIVVQCDDCGKLMSVPELDLYVPVEVLIAKKWTQIMMGQL